MRLVDDSTCPDSQAQVRHRQVCSSLARGSRPARVLRGCTCEELQHGFLVALVPGSVQVVATFDFH